MRKHKIKKYMVWTALLFCFISAAGCGSPKIAKKTEQKADPQKQEEAYQKMQEAAAVKSGDPSADRIDFEELKKKNPDIYAWIYIPGTNIDYPVLQSQAKEDEYYLNTTIDKKTGLPGSIYTEKYNRTDFTDPVTVVYGHTLKEGTMFSELSKYTDRSFFDQNPYIYIYQPDKTMKYQIFSAVAFDDRYLLGSYNFANAEEVQEYIGELNSSLDGNVNNGIAVSPQNKILTLSTCIDEFPEQRWLVNAVLLENQ